MNRRNSCISDRSIEIKNNFKATLKSFNRSKKTNVDKFQNDVNKTQKKRVVAFSKINNESDKLQKNQINKTFKLNIDRV